MKRRYIRNSQGVALVAALFVLMVMSIMAIALLMNVDEDQRMSKSVENSEMALKVAEAGVQVARSTFFDPAIQEITQTEELASIDGFYRGGYFLAQLESGFRGNEKWTQWRYDSDVTGYNDRSEVSTPVFQVWATAADGVNGSWEGSGWDDFKVRNLYGIVAKGTYFTVQDASGDTRVRAHDETSGVRLVDADDPAFSADYHWNYDKKLTGTIPGLADPVNYSVHLSPMASFTNYTTKVGMTVPVIATQTLYFTYAGNSTDLSSGVDRSSTVRLRASNALCNYNASQTETSAPDLLKPLWEFDTGLHGIGTAPAFFDPDPSNPGDEIIYFAVASRGTPGSDSALNLNASSSFESYAYPSLVYEDSEQIYLFAIVDTTIPDSTDVCNTTGSYRLKWTRPFPDPDVVNWTDYPTEHATGTAGTEPPFVRSPADMVPFMPEEDLLTDYRDGPGTNAEEMRGDATGNFSDPFDGQWNQVRGNLAGLTSDVAIGPPVVKVLYRTDSASSGNLTELRQQAADPFDPLIDIYLMYSTISRASYVESYGGVVGFSLSMYYDNIRGFHGTGWGPEGYRKPILAQTRVIALRDQVARSGSNWNWLAAKSRYPQFKWSYLVPAWDPDQTASSPDARPGNGYGEYTWDTWFEQQVASMVHTVPWNQDGSTLWADVGGTGVKNGGYENLYNVIYPYYKSAGFYTYGAYNNNVAGPANDTTDRSPVDFGSDIWDDARIMVMAIRDTWDDYQQGIRTNVSGTNLDRLNMGLSNPFEHYWTHTDNADDPNTAVITYNSTLRAQYAANSTTTGKIGFPRPYSWWEALWDANVQAAAGTLPQSLAGQGWDGMTYAAGITSNDLDVEGETMALCPDCEFQRGLLLLSLNHDIISTSPYLEDLRLHAINATTGVHKWDYHLPASLAGDDANTTPALANGLAFMAYQAYTDDKSDPGNTREARLLVLNADNGLYQQDTAIDRDADALILPPTIANGALYVGTYDMNYTFGPSNIGDDQIRLFALSPVLRLVSTGIYPFDQFGANYPFGYRNYTGGGFTKITSLDHDTIFKNPSGELRGVWKRKLQVWITGQNSKWEEVREVLEED